MEIALALGLPVILVLLLLYITMAMRAAFAGEWPGEDENEDGRQPVALPRSAAHVFGVVWLIFEIVFFLAVFVVWVSAVMRLVMG